MPIPPAGSQAFRSKLSAAVLIQAAIAGIATFSLAPKPAVAQLSAIPETGCYIEWTAGVQTSLEALCTPSAAPSQSATQPNQSNRLPSATDPSTTKVEIVSEVGSTVYINGLRASQPTNSLQNQITQNQIIRSQPIEEPIYFQYPQTRSSRRYLLHQRFYPHPALGQPSKEEHQLQEVPLLPPGFSFRQHLF